MYYYHNTCYLCSQAYERKNYLLFSRWHMLQASKQTSSFGKNQYDGSFFSFCKDLCRGQGHIRRSCVHLTSFVRNQGRGQSQVHAETAICNEPGFPKEQASSSCSLLTSSIPRQIPKSDSSFLSPLQLSILSEHP